MITEFKKWHWYRRVVKNHQPAWSTVMNAVLDGKPHFCISGDGCFATLEGVNSGAWKWGLHEFEEVTHEFKPGDRVKLSKNILGCQLSVVMADLNTKKTLYGTVLFYRNDGCFSVEWDDNIDGHDEKGKGKDKHCWGILPIYLSLADTDVDEDSDEMEDEEDEEKLVEQVEKTKMELKEIKKENRVEAIKQVTEEKMNAEIQYAKDQYRMAIDNINDFDRKIKSLEEQKKPYIEIIEKMKEK
jgi:hypothetical protein